MHVRLRWMWLATVAVVTAPFWGLIVGRETAIYGDLIYYHLPAMRWITGRWFDGQLPEWAPWVFAGQNVIGAGQGAAFYPLTPLLGLLPVVPAYKLWFLLHLWIATTGAFVWSWRTWGSRLGAAVSGIAYGLNGFLVLHMVHMNLVMASAWLPWALLGIDAVIDRWTVRRAALAAAPIALIALSGHPQVLWIGGVGIAVYSAVRLVGRHPNLRAVGRVCAATALGLGLAAVALLPQREFANSSTRSEQTMQRAFTYSARPEHLITAVFPGAMGGVHDVPGGTAEWTGRIAQHEVATHTGIVVVALAAIGFVGRRRDRRAIAFGVITLFALATAVATSGPIPRWVYHWLPMAASFRAWARNLVLLNLAASLMAGAGMAVLDSWDHHRRRRVAIIIGLSTLVLANLAMLTRLGGTIVPGFGFLAGIAVPLAATTVMVWALCIWQHRRTLAAVLLLGACAVDMAFFAYGAPWRYEAVSSATASQLFDDGLAHTGRAVDAPGGVDRWVTNDVHLLSLAALNGTQVVNGYDPLMQRQWSAMTSNKWSGELLDDRMWAPGWYPDVLRITTAFLRDNAPSSTAWEEVGMPDDGMAMEYRYEPRLPAAYVSTHVVVTDLDGVGDALANPASDLTRTTYVETQYAAAVGALTATGPRPLRQVEGAMGDHGRGTFRTDSGSNGLLVVSTAWLNGWSATVDGHSVPIVRANGLLLSVPVPAGQHVVHFVFQTPGVRTGGTVSVISLGVLLASGGPPRFRRASGRRLLRRS